MKINLPLSGFAPFKVITSVLFLLSFLVFRNFMMVLVVMIPVIVGKAHALGAWISMWRAGKLNFVYVFFMLFFIVLFTYLGLNVLTIIQLSLLTSVLFIFHFMYDEFDLQEERRELAKFIAPGVTFVLFVMYLLNQSVYFSLDANVFVWILSLSIFLELILIKQIDWFFINMKVIQVFLFYFMYMGISPTYLMGTILVWHYFFWFIYPVYKIGKKDKKERNALIMILLILVGTSYFYSSTQDFIHEYIQEYALRYFNILTIVHILGTAPFAYLFGLKMKKESNTELSSGTKDGVVN